MRAKILRELARENHPISERIPPHREWARRLRVSNFTVQRAFEALKQEGIVDSREGSRTFLRQLPDHIPLEEVMPGPKAKTRLTLWFGEPKDVRWMRKSLFREQFAKRFLAVHPDTKIDEHLFDIPGGVLETRILYHMLRGNEPTAAQVRRTCLPQLAEHGALAPIIEPSCEESYLAKLNPRWIEVCRTGKNLHLLPSAVSCSFLLYNKELFLQAGLDPDHPPRDWEEFLAAAHTLKESRGGQPSFHLIDDYFLIWWLMQLAYQAMPKEALTTAGHPAPLLPPVDWLGSAARKAIKFFLKLGQEKVLELSSENVIATCSRCLKDEIPMMMGDSRLTALFVKLKQAEKFGIAPMPSGPNGQVISMLNCGGWILNAHASPEEQAVASRYVFARERFVHLGGGGAQMKAIGILPSLLPLLRTPFRDTFATTPLPADWRRVLEQLTAVGRWEPEDGDWKKEVLAPVVPAFLKAPASHNPQHVQHSLALAETGGGEVERPTTPLP